MTAANNTPVPDVRERLVDTGTQYLGLTDVERAAAMVDPHMQACDVPRLSECRYCRNRLATIQELVAAVEPAIRRQALDEVADHLDVARYWDFGGTRHVRDALAIARSHSTQPETGRDHG